MRLLGLRVRDTVTGFEGIATDFSAELGGGASYFIEPGYDAKRRDVYSGNDGRRVNEGRVEEVVATKRGRKPKAAPPAAPAAKPRAKKA